MMKNKADETQVLENKNDEATRLFTRQLYLKNIFEKLFLLPKIPQMDRWVAVEFSKNKKFGSKDRKWYLEQIFSIVRNLYFILYMCEYSDSTLEIFEKEINDSKTFWNAIKHIPFEDLYSAHNILNQSENNFLNLNTPLWLKPYLVRRFNNHDNLQHFLNLQNIRPALWIRVNHTEKNSEILNDFKLHGIDIQPQNNQNTFVISNLNSKSIYQLDTFKKGFFEIQDYASQEIGHALNIKPGEYIWDVCAGGGGKTLQIASLLNNQGVLYATDIRSYKLDELKNRLKQAQFFNVRTMTWDGLDLPEFPKEIQNNKGFDSILVDAPCSGSGTWRRHPDEKYRTDKEKIAEYARLQFQILSVVCHSLKSEGTLIYATCSVFMEENEDIIDKFLIQNTDFKLTQMKMLHAPNDNSDFMFVAVLKHAK